MRMIKTFFFIVITVVMFVSITSAETFGYGRTGGLRTDGNITYNTTNIYNNYTINGSVLFLNNLSDVDVPAPANGESLVWSSGLSKWVADTVISRWTISTTNGYLYTSGDSLYFNDTKLNETIDSRAAAASNNFEVFINGSAYNNVTYNITAGDVADVEYVIEPGKKFIFADKYT